MKPYIISQHLRYDLYDDISDFSKYEDFFVDMSEMTAEDKVTIRINSGGGRVDVGHMIVQAIQDCKAHVHCVVAHASYSMASIIAVSGDELTMLPHSLLMFHNYTSGAGGKGDELLQGILSTDEYIKSIFRDICSPFLTAAEFKRLERDHDVYIKYNDPTLAARTARHFKKRDKS